MSKNKDLDPYWADYVARWERVMDRDGKVMYRFKGCTEPLHALDDPTLPTPPALNMYIHAYTMYIHTRIYNVSTMLGMHTV